MKVDQDALREWAYGMGVESGSKMMSFITTSTERWEDFPTLVELTELVTAFMRGVEHSVYWNAREWSAIGQYAPDTREAQWRKRVKEERERQERRGWIK